MKYLAILCVAALTACSAITPKIDERTGTTLGQRCIDYKAALSAAQALSDEEDRKTRIAIYQALITPYCAGQ